MTLDDALLVEVKTVAAATGRTMNQVIADAVRAALARSDREAAPRAELPTFMGGPLREGVDLDDSAALLDLMEGTSR